MDAVSYNLASKQAKRIEKFIENPDSNSGVLTQPKVIEAGETVTIKSGRQAILANTLIEGDLIIEDGGEVFVPAGAVFNDVDQRIDTLDITTVKLTGDQTITGVKTFSSNIVGNITGNAATATTLSTNRNNYKNFTDSVVVGELMWKHNGNGHTIFDASNSTSPTGVAINNRDPDVPWTISLPTLMGYNGNQTFGVRVDSSRFADFATAFTTAVGSAPSYACRAWVNFNGTGTVAIRASGNVSSITDNGVGNYNVNFTNAMPDSEASIVANSDSGGGAGNKGPYVILISATYATIYIYNSSGAFVDAAIIDIAVFR